MRFSPFCRVAIARSQTHVSFELACTRKNSSGFVSFILSSAGSLGWRERRGVAKLCRRVVTYGAVRAFPLADASRLARNGPAFLAH